MQTLGSLGGLLTLIAVPLLAIPFIRRRRELRRVRAQLAANRQLEARLAAAAPVAAGAALVSPAALAAPAPVATRAPRPVVSPTPRIAAPVAAPAPAPAPAPALAPAPARARAPARAPARGTATAPRRVRVRPGVLAIAGAVIVGAFGAFVILDHGSSSRPPTGRPGSVAGGAVPAFTAVPIAVLNATSVQHAAGDLAQQLRSDGVRIAAVGNVVESRPAGLAILYAPGVRPQAERLARMLAARSPTVAPIDRDRHAARGSRPRRPCPERAGVAQYHPAPAATSWQRTPATRQSPSRSTGLECSVPGDQPGERVGLRGAGGQCQ